MASLLPLFVQVETGLLDSFAYPVRRWLADKTLWLRLLCALKKNWQARDASLHKVGLQPRRVCSSSDVSYGYPAVRPTSQTRCLLKR